jgi:hypothetical protein
MPAQAPGQVEGEVGRGFWIVITADETRVIDDDARPPSRSAQRSDASSRCETTRGDGALSILMTRDLIARVLVRPDLIARV